MTDARSRSPALDLTVLLGLGTALIYTAGWAYAYHWYGNFNLGIIGLDIPLEYFLMYGFWTARAHWWLVLVYAVGVALWLFLRERLQPWLWRAAPVWVLFLFWLAYALGGQAARTDYATHQRNGFACYPLARLGGLKSEDKRTATLHDLAEQLSERDYRLLLQTKGLLVLIKPKPQTAPVPVVVPLSSIDVLRVTPVNPGCRG